VSLEKSTMAIVKGERARTVFKALDLIDYESALAGSRRF
jgi:hypothetical protein